MRTNPPVHLSEYNEQTALYCADDTHYRRNGKTRKVFFGNTLYTFPFYLKHVPAKVGFYLIPYKEENFKVGWINKKHR